MSANGSSPAKLELMEERMAALELEVNQLKMSQEKSLLSGKTNADSAATPPVLLSEKSMRSGNLFIKAAFGDEILRLKIPHNMMYNALIDLVKESFRDCHLSSQRFRIKCMDKDGDLVTVRNDDDLSHFICLDPIPRITILIQK